MLLGPSSEINCTCLLSNKGNSTNDLKDTNTLLFEPNHVHQVFLLLDQGNTAGREMRNSFSYFGISPLSIHSNPFITRYSQGEICLVVQGQGGVMLLIGFDWLSLSCESIISNYSLHILKILQVLLASELMISFRLVI